MMNYNEQKTVIDVSDAVNISDLGIKITNMLDTCNSKELYLKLGKIDLKQSQLLGIKALVEVMQAKIVGVETTSEITEASAIGLGIAVSDSNCTPVDNTPTFSETFKQETPAETTSSDELSSFSQLKKLNSIGDFVTDADNLAEVENENIWFVFCVGPDGRLMSFRLQKRQNFRQCSFFFKACIPFRKHKEQGRFS